MEKRRVRIPALRESSTSLILLAGLGGVCGSIWGFAQGDGEPLRSEFGFWFVLILLAIFALLVALLRPWRPTVVELDRDEVRFTGPLGGWSFHPAELKRLSVLESSASTKLFICELENGKRHHVGVMFSKDAEELYELFDALARRTGHKLRGREAPREMSGSASLPELVAALRAASGTDSHTGMLRWILGHAFFLRFDEVGVNNAFLSWGSRVFQIGGLVFLAVVLWLEWLILDEGLLMAGLAILAMVTAWCICCLGVNIILLMLGQQIRVGEAIDAELEAAERVQQQLLPASGPVFAGLEVAGSCTSAREVGGDYYDYFEHGNRVVLAIADVAGKGLPAALLMTMAKGALGAALQQRGDLQRTLAAVHEQVLQNRVDRRLVTMALVEIDRRAGQATVARAGHEPPLLVRADGEVVPLMPDGIAVGIGRPGQFAAALRVETVPFERGDLLVLYTDGVTEARNEAGEEFGSARLHAALGELGHESAERVRTGLLARLEDFRGDAAVTDDITLVIVRASE